MLKTLPECSLLRIPPKQRPRTPQKRGDSLTPYLNHFFRNYSFDSCVENLPTNEHDSVFVHNFHFDLNFNSDIIFLKNCTVWSNFKKLIPYNICPQRRSGNCVSIIARIYVSEFIRCSYMREFIRSQLCERIHSLLTAIERIYSLAVMWANLFTVKTKPPFFCSATPFLGMNLKWGGVCDFWLVFNISVQPHVLNVTAEHKVYLEK